MRPRARWTAIAIVLAALVAAIGMCAMTWTRDAARRDGWTTTRATTTVGLARDGDGEDARGDSRCEVAVPTPVDVSPVRSPQAVHTVIASLLATKTVVEIGSRNGDGVMCFARAARATSVVEYDKAYCEKLERRARSARGIALRVQCEDYRTASLDADYVTWWQQGDVLTNENVLQTLRARRAARRVRRGVEAVLIFDHSWPSDARDLKRFEEFFNWRKEVWFNETVACDARKSEIIEKDESGFSCDRAGGWFTVAKISIKDLPRDFAS